MSRQDSYRDLGEILDKISELALKLESVMRHEMMVYRTLNHAHLEIEQPLNIAGYHEGPSIGCDFQECDICR